MARTKPSEYHVSRWANSAFLFKESVRVFTKCNIMYKRRCKVHEIMCNSWSFRHFAWAPRCQKLLTRIDGKLEILHRDHAFIHKLMESV